MARADLILKLVEAETLGNKELFKKTVEAIIAEERSKNHSVYADRLTEKLQALNMSTINKRNNNILDNKIEYKSMGFEQIPNKRLDELFLSSNVEKICKDFIEEQFRRELLYSYNLEPRNRILLAGPPGNGKTSLAEAIATELMIPFFVVRYDELIGSYLGETATNLKKMFDHIRTYNCVLFFDEFDAIAKERGDTHETGEIKRVVSSLLMQIDKLPNHVVVVVATNHPELLDRAIWRRFQIRIQLPNPSKMLIGLWLKNFFSKFISTDDLNLERISTALEGLSFAEVEEFGLDIKRKYVLSLGANIDSIINNCLKELKEKYVLNNKGGKVK